MNSRRNILRRTSLLAMWTSPAVSSIILPVHAQTSVRALFDEVIVGLIGIRCGSPGRFRLEMIIGLARFNENGSQDPRLEGLEIDLVLTASGSDTPFFSTNEVLKNNTLKGVRFEIELDDRVSLIEFVLSAVEPLTEATITARGRLDPLRFGVSPGQCN